MIYIGLGDKAVDSAAQDKTVNAGCLIRLNYDGSIPAGNVGSGNSAGCWLKGVRNFYKIAVSIYIFNLLFLC